jgi:hypothetical protein
MSIKNLIGVIIQSIIWLCIIYIRYDAQYLYEYPDYFIFIILCFLLLVYFYEFCFNSNLFSILSKKLIIVNTKMDIIKFLVQSKPYLEIVSRAYHYNYEKINVTHEKYQLFNFDEIKDFSIIKSMKLYPEEIHVDGKIILLDINLLIKFLTQEQNDELDQFILKIKNEISLKDKYYDCKTKFIFRYLEEKNNLFMLNKGKVFLFKKGFMIFFYALLLGEFYKLYIEYYIYYTSVDLVKQIGGHKNDRS